MTFHEAITVSTIESLSRSRARRQCSMNTETATASTFPSTVPSPSTDGQSWSDFPTSMLLPTRKPTNGDCLDLLHSRGSDFILWTLLTYQVSKHISHLVMVVIADAHVERRELHVPSAKQAGERGCMVLGIASTMGMRQRKKKKSAREKDSLIKTS